MTILLSLGWGLLLSLIGGAIVAAVLLIWALNRQQASETRMMLDEWEEPYP